MTTFALLSELDRLPPTTLARPDLHIICDDGTWTEEQITCYINQWHGHSILHETRDEDWTRKDGELL